MLPALGLTGRGLAAGIGGAAGGVAIGMAVQRVGPVAALLPALMFGAFLLVQFPRLALGLLLGIAVMFEDDPEGFLSFTTNVYLGVPSPLDLIFAATIAAALVEIGRTKEPPRLPGPFTIPLVLLGLAFAGGVATGYFANGDRGEMLTAITTAGLFLITPFLVVNLIHGRERVRMFAGVALAAAALKGVIGCAGWLLGLGRAFGDGVLTYYEPTANWVMVIFLLALVAAPLMRAPLPLWAKIAAPFVLAALLLSFRRAFWLAGGLGLVTLLLCVLVGENRRSRVLLPAALIAALGIGAYVAAGAGTQTNPIAERAETINPTAVQQDAQDKYRIDENRNVRQEIAEDPITGIGLGIPWEARHPLAIQNDGGRQYTHVLFLWYWLKLGLFGLVGIASLFAIAVWTSYGLWRRGAEPWLKAAGLTLMCAFIGLLVAETTASFSGVDGRFSIVLGAIIGWLAVARDLQPPPEPA